MEDQFPTALKVILGFIGVGQVATVVMVAFVRLWISNGMQTTKEEVLKEVRGEFVSAEVAAQRFSTTNLLLTNLAQDIGGIRANIGSIDTRLSHLEGRVGEGSRGGLSA